MSIFELQIDGLNWYLISNAIILLFFPPVIQVRFFLLNICLVPLHYAGLQICIIFIFS